MSSPSLPDFKLIYAVKRHLDSSPLSSIKSSSVPASAAGALNSNATDEIDDMVKNLCRSNREYARIDSQTFKDNVRNALETIRGESTTGTTTGKKKRKVRSMSADEEEEVRG